MMVVNRLIFVELLRFRVVINAGGGYAYFMLSYRVISCSPRMLN